MRFADFEGRRVYVACPYSDGQRSVRDARARAANEVAGLLIRAGAVVFSPISHTHEMAEQQNLPTDYAFWERQCLAFVEWCDAMVVLAVDGWQESRGVVAELRAAWAAGKGLAVAEPLRDGWVLTELPLGMSGRLEDEEGRG